MINIAQNQGFLSKSFGPQNPNAVLFGKFVKHQPLSKLVVSIDKPKGEERLTTGVITVWLYIADSDSDDPCDCVEVDLTTSENILPAARLFEDVVIPVSELIRNAGNEDFYTAAIAHGITSRQNRIKVTDERLTGEVKFTLDLGEFVFEGAAKREEVMRYFKWEALTLATICE